VARDGHRLIECRDLERDLATEYCYRHASDYDAVWWVRAEEPATLAADYALLAQEVALPEQTQTTSASRLHPHYR